MFEKIRLSKAESKAKATLEQKINYFDSEYEKLISAAEQDKIEAYKIGCKIVSDLDEAGTKYIDAVLQNMKDYNSLYKDWSEHHKNLSFYEYVYYEKGYDHWEKFDFESLFKVMSVVGGIGTAASLIVYIIFGKGPILATETVASLLSGLIGVGGLFLKDDLSHIKIPADKKYLSKKDYFEKIYGLQHNVYGVLENLYNSLQAEKNQEGKTVEEQSAIQRELDEMMKLKSQLNQTLESHKNPAYKSEEIING